MKLTVNFEDFWPGFNYEDNYFLNLLQKNFEVELSSNPELLIYSVFGRRHAQYDCLKIKYVGENVRYNRFESDYFIGFDRSDGTRSRRWPLYKLYGNPCAIPIPCGARDRFCCIVVSNPGGEVRNSFFRALSLRKQVDSGGRFLNNVGGPVDDKIEFLSRYRFSIAFEHSSYPGYCTEKLFEAKKAGTIPIYWGDPCVHEDFRPGSFISLHDFRSLDECIEYVLAVDSDPRLYHQIRTTPLDSGDWTGRLADTAALEDWLLGVVRGRQRYLRSAVLARITDRFNNWRTDRFNRQALQALIPPLSDLPSKPGPG